jgi:MFS family permease
MVGGGWRVADATASIGRSIGWHGTTRADDDTPMPHAEPLLTRRFVLVVGAGFAYFMGLGTVLPVVPQYVRHELGGGDVAVGVAVGVLFAGAVLLRPFAGRLGDRFGRRLLILGGAAIVAVSIALYGAVESLPFLIFARLLTGVGEAAFFVGATSMIADLAPVSRRGEAISYWSVAVYGGLAFGPALGETILDASDPQTVFAAASLIAVVAVVLGAFIHDVDRPLAAVTGSRLVSRGAVVPGVILFSGLIAFAAFGAFVPLYVDDVGLGGADLVFLLYGGLVLAIRLLGARLPDQLGPRRAGSAALAFTALGMTVMALWGSAAGLLVGTAFFAIGASLLYPSLLLLALSNAPETERGAVVGTISSFFDASQAIGSLVVGGVAEVAGYRGAFALGALFALAGLAPLRSRTASRRSAHIAEAGVLSAEHPSP